MGKIKYAVEVDGVEVGVRKSDRGYSHAVVVLPSEDYDRGFAEGNAALQAKANYGYNVRYAGMSRDEAVAKIDSECVGRDAWRAEYKMKDLDENMAIAECNAFKAEYPDVEAYRAALLAGKLAAIDEGKANGYYQRWLVSGYCGRLDLAQKLRQKDQASGCWADVRIVPVVVK